MAYKLIDKRYDPFSKGERRCFLCDTDDDFANLPACDTGSIAITPAGTGRIVNASGEWVEYVRATGGGNSQGYETLVLFLDEVETSLDNVLALQNSYIRGGGL